MIFPHHHAKKIVQHIQVHHKKYLFLGGVAGSIFLAMKIVVLFGTSFVLYNGAKDIGFAQEISLDTGVVLEATGSLDTEISTGDVETSTGVVDTEISTGDVEIATGVVDTEISTGDIETSTGVVDTEITEDTTEEVIEEVTEEIAEDTTSSFIESQTEDVVHVCQNGDLIMQDFLSGVVFKDVASFQWTLSGTCQPTTYSFQVYQQDQQWVELAQLSGSAHGFSFDTNQILGTGLYWSGYMAIVFDEQGHMLYNSPAFTIDHMSPSLTGIVLTSSGGLTTGLLGIASPLKIIFDASEDLTGIQVLISSGEASLISQSGLHYEYGLYMTSSQNSGNVNYSIQFSDLAGNTGLVESGTEFVFDKTFPIVSSLSIGIVSSKIQVSYTSQENALSNIILSLHNYTTGGIINGSGYVTGYDYTFTLLSGYSYDLSLSLLDLAGNQTTYKYLLNYNASGFLSYSFVSVIYGTDFQRSIDSTLGLQFNLTGGISLSGSTMQSVLNLVKKEIDKFNTCKNDIDFTTIQLQIKGNQFNLQMPQFKNNEVRKIVNAFSYYIVQKLNKTGTLEQSELDDLTKRFNNFLVILKLVKDDDNACKQNLTNYNISEFKDIMETYGITGL